MPACRLTRLALMLMVATPITVIPDTVSAQNGSGNSKSKGAKTASSKSTSANVRAIDVKADRLQTEFVRNAALIAKDYADAGQLEKSKQILETLLKLNPALSKVRERIKLLDESILQSNSKQVEIDAADGWSRPLAQVFKGRKFRIRAAGTYKFVTDVPLSVQGFPEGAQGLAPGIPCGALMGMIISKGKPGKPFIVQKGRELAPKEGGLLVLRVNTPPGSKCSGKLQIQLSGYAKTKP